jgi:abhydrolase domain-containing protein 12
MLTRIAKIMAAIVAILSVLLIHPATQSSFVYLNFVRWPIFTAYSDLESLGIAHIARNIEIVCTHNITLQGYHLVPPPDEPHAPPVTNFEESLLEASTVVIYFHGNAASRALGRRIQHIQKVSAALDAHLVTFDYRGFADSTGSPSEEGIAHDSQVVLEWVRARTRKNDKAPEIYFYGHSLGTATSSRLAYDTCSKHSSMCDTAKSASMSLSTTPGVSGIILDAPFNTLRDVALMHPFSAGFRALLGAEVVNKYFAVHEKWETEFRLGSIDLPVLILHGLDDTEVPFLLGKRLRDNVRSTRSKRGSDASIQLVAYPGCDHESVFQQESFTRELKKFQVGIRTQRKKEELREAAFKAQPQGD